MSAAQGAFEPGFDALRGCAVFGVFAHHLHAYTGLSLPVLGVAGGLLGVQLFFLISGYLIVSSARREPPLGYLVRRAFRIFPAYWAVVATLTLSRGLLADAAEHPWLFLANWWALTHAVPAALLRFDVTTVAWTLTIELGWYLLVPLLVAIEPAGAAVRARYWRALLVVSLLLSIAWVTAAQAGVLDAPFEAAIAAAGVAPVDAFMRFAFIVNALPAQLAFFVAGAWFATEPRVLDRIPDAALAAAAVAFALPAAGWNDLLGLHPAPLSGLGLLAFLVLVRRRLAVRVGKFAAGWCWLGRVSYPVYLVHVPLIIAVSAALAGSGWLVAAAAAVAVGITAQLLHHLIERPGIALGRRIAARVQPNARTSPSV
ncbi:MAG: acyltransferase [Burkholderiales bacterium]|nr:MAG: acyltransferase [Burkholderiales bacterium]